MSIDRRQLFVGALAGAAIGGYGTGARAQQGAAAGSSGAGFSDSFIDDPNTRRRIKLRLRLPDDAKPAPMIVYSPGLGSGLDNGAPWADAWRKAGFAVLTLAHPVTDDSIWDRSKRTLRANMKIALEGDQYAYRVRDCRYAIDHALREPAIASRIDANRIGVAGHSFGAITTQSLAKETAAGKGPRGAGEVRAAIALSPGASTATAPLMRPVKLPFLVVTGDNDVAVTFGHGDGMRLSQPLKNRLLVYENLPAGNKQLLLMARCDHMTFAGEKIDPARFSREVRYAAGEEAAIWQRVAAITTLFWQRHLGSHTTLPRDAWLAEVTKHLVPKDQFKLG